MDRNEVLKSTPIVDLKYNHVIIRQELQGKVDVTQPKSDEHRDLDLVQGILPKREAIDPQQIREDLVKGHLFANIGVSSIVTLDHKGTDYLVLVRQGDRLKLPSGYVERENDLQPRKAAEKENNEELLFLTERGELIRHRKGHFVFPNPFPDKFPDSSYTIDVRLGSRFSFHFPDNNITLEGKLIAATEMNGPKIYFHPNTNSAQWVFEYHISSNESTSANALHTIVNTGEKPDSNKPPQNLETFLYPEDIVLAKLEPGITLTRRANRRFDGALYRFEDRQPKYQEDLQNLELAEPFCDEEGGFVLDKTIPYREYLARQ